MKKLTQLSALALVGLAFSSPAWAQDVSASDTDLILSFRSWNGTGTGSTSDLEVDLGPASLFTAGSPTFTSTPSTNLNVQDLISTFGSTWATDGDVAFNVAGLTDDSNYYGYVTQNLLNNGSPQADSSAFTGTPGESISQVALTLNGQTDTGDSTGAAVIPDSTIGSYSYEEYHGTTATTHKAYSYFVVTNGDGTGTTNLSDTEALVHDVNGVTDTTLKLYSYDGSDAPTLEGTFDLSSAGVLTYTSAPEPSTWAMMLGGLGLLFLAARRRWISNLS